MCKKLDLVIFCNTSSTWPGGSRWVTVGPFSNASSKNRARLHLKQSLVYLNGKVIDPIVTMLCGTIHCH